MKAPLLQMKPRAALAKHWQMVAASRDEVTMPLGCPPYVVVTFSVLSKGLIAVKVEVLVALFVALLVVVLVAM